MSQNRMLDAALVYADWDWPVFPCAPGSKEPLKGSHGVKDATTDADQIRQWWAKHPDANIGLACGEMVAVDLDVKDGRNGRETWAALGIASNTATSRTPTGGQHLIYRANGATIRNSTNKLGSGVDVRGKGGYIVLPPSTLGNGAAYTWEARPDKTPPLPLPGALAALLASPEPDPRPSPLTGCALAANAEPYARAALESELDDLARTPQGGRNHQLNTAAFNLGQLVGAGALDRGEVEAELERMALGIGLDPGEIGPTMKSGLDAGEKQPRIIPEPTRQPVPSEPPAATEPARVDLDQAPALDNYNLTDLGNAERLIAQHGDKLHWCDPWGCWLVWDGKRWKRDDLRTVERWAVDVIRGIYGAAYEEADPDRRAAMARWAAKCEADYRRQAMISSARTFAAILPDDLDADPWLLTCANGTLDLRTGKLQRHNPADLITKLVPVDYDPNAQAPTWEAFLDRILRGNQDLIAFLRRAVGYSLTGITWEQVLFILYGTGANGKSTFLEALADLLDDYARKTPSETLLVKRHSSIPNDVARLKGARLVTAGETEEGRRLAENFVKQMTGGDTIAARFMRAEWFEFVPEFKLFLATNHKPQIRGTDLAIWRRIRLVPFTVTIPPDEQDKELPDKLRAELPGILAWAVRGCQEWQRDGLGTPAEVHEATRTYKSEMDVLGGFLDDCCIVEETAQARAGQLYETYRQWCTLNGERAISGSEFSQRLLERGFDKYRDTQGVHYIGLGLLAKPDEGGLPM